MKISDILAQSRIQLDKSGVSNSKLDSLVLLTHALSFSKEQVIFNPDMVLSQDQCKKFLTLVKRRETFEPISQIIGKREFYGRDFIVTKDVLDPRPDSESLIELVLAHIDPSDHLNILEVGSGTGCLTITLLKELPKSQAVTLDISEDALEICRQNIAFYNLTNRLTPIKSNIFTSLRKKQTQKFDLIISNPPYIQSKQIETLQPEVKLFEPKMALDGGEDGLNFYRQLAAQSQEFLLDNGKIFLEIGYGQTKDVETIFNQHGFTLKEVKKDLAGIQRALYFELL
jgi:release factor glutamine methyltransferase